MPHKPKHKLDLNIPEWVDRLPGEEKCVWENVVEALVARRAAIKAGAESNKACNAALRAGDATLERLSEGRKGNRSAAKQATDALRKYVVAQECAAPTARSFRGLGRRSNCKRR